MSTLQISLAVIGVIVLGLIVAYNAWNNRRNTPKRASGIDAARTDEGVARFDPALDGAAMHAGVDITETPAY